MNTSRWNSVTRVQPLANGTARRKPSSTVVPGSDDAQLVQQLDQLAVGALLRRLLFRRAILVHVRKLLPCVRTVKGLREFGRTKAHQCAYSLLSDPLDLPHRCLL